MKVTTECAIQRLIMQDTHCHELKNIKQGYVGMFFKLNVNKTQNREHIYN